MSEVIVEYRHFTLEELEQERAYYREKRLHDEATVLGNAKREGRAEARAKLKARMREQGYTDEQIKALFGDT